MRGGNNRADTRRTASSRRRRDRFSREHIRDATGYRRPAPDDHQPEDWDDDDTRAKH